MARKRLRKFFYSYWFIFLFFLAFFLRLPSLFEPFTYGDEGIYLTLGQAIRKGLVIYRDIHDNKPPLLYLLAAATGSFSYFRLILFAWSSATIYLFFKLCQFLFPKNNPAQIVSTFVFAILISIHTFEGNVANAENFLVGTTIAGFYFCLKARRRWQYFLAGVLFGLSVLFKVPAVFDLAALFTFILVTSKTKDLAGHLLDTILGFLAPILVSVIYFASKNALCQYLTAAFWQNLPYLASWTVDKPKAFSLPLPLLSRAIIAFLTILVVFRLRKKLSLPAKLVISWFSFSLFGALLSSRPYPHYLLQAIPALALSLGLLFLKKKKERFVPSILIFVFVLVFIGFKFWHYPNLSYYQNFYQFLLSQKSRRDYLNYFGNQTEAIYQTAAFIRIRTKSDERIFIWGNQPSIYTLSRRLPVGRYTVAYHIIDFNGYEETMKALTQNLPRYIIISDEEKRPFSSLIAFIQTKYAFEKQIGQFQIFHRITPAN